MGRVILFFKRRARDWLDLSVNHTHVGIDAGTQGGMDSYACKQAAMFRKMAEKNGERWRDVRARVELVFSSKVPVDSTDVAVPPVMTNEDEEDELLGPEIDQTVDTWDFGNEEDF